MKKKESMEKEFIVKVHSSYRWVVAICDKELLGKRIEEGEKQLDLTGTFFKGEEKTKEELIKLIGDYLREDATFNIIGKKSCDLVKELKLVVEAGILRIRGIPYTLILL